MPLSPVREVERGPGAHVCSGQRQDMKQTPRLGLAAQGNTQSVGVSHELGWYLQATLETWLQRVLS